MQDAAQSENEADEEEEDNGEPKVPREKRKKFVFGRTEDQMMKPGPFDDLFTGPDEDDKLVGSPDEASLADQAKKERNRAKRQRRQARKQGHGVAAGSAQ